MTYVTNCYSLVLPTPKLNTYCCKIVTKLITACFKIIDNLGQAVRKRDIDGLFDKAVTRNITFKRNFKIHE